YQWLKFLPLNPMESDIFSSLRPNCDILSNPCTGFWRLPVVGSPTLHRRRIPMRCRTSLLAFLSVVAVLRVATHAGWPALRASVQAAPAGVPSASAPIEVVVHEGTSMAVAATPAGHTRALDLQGSIGPLPATGGRAPRLTEPFDDARQPTWSPDGTWITFFSYRDGSYHLWAVAPDGSHLHPLTWGPFDDREPVWSHDGTRLAFASDRGDPLGSHSHIWVLEVATGACTQLTQTPTEHAMPTWSPDDQEIAFVSTSDHGTAVWAVHVATGAERQITTAPGRV